MLTDILPGVSEQESWTSFIDDAYKFHKAATGGLGRREVFSPDILYNIFSMAMEKYFMGFFLQRGNLPDNHTFKDLADAVQRVTPVERVLLDDLYYLDSFQEICSVDHYQRKEISEDDIRKIANICERVKGFVVSKLPER